MPDPDLEIGGGGEDGGPVSKRNFLALRASVWSKNKGGGGHPGHSAGSATGLYLVYVTRHTFRSFSSLSLALFFHAGLFH